MANDKPCLSTNLWLSKAHSAHGKNLITIKRYTVDEVN